MAERAYREPKAAKESDDTLLVDVCDRCAGSGTTTRDPVDIRQTSGCPFLVRIREAQVCSATSSENDHQFMLSASSSV